MKRRHRLAHRRIWFVLAVVLPTIVAVALLTRAPRNVENPVLRLSELAR